MSSLPLKDAQENEEVIIRRKDGGVYAVWTVRGTTKTQIGAMPPGYINFASIRKFSLASGKEIGGDRTIERAAPGELAAAKEWLREREAAAKEAEDAKRQAAYDALPEAVKLARKVQFALDSTGEADWASLPLEPLRELVAWFASHKAKGKQ